MLPAIGLAAEALTTFICGLYTGFRWAHRPSSKTLTILPELGIVCGIAAVSWLVDSTSGGAFASGLVATCFFFFVFGAFKSPWLLLHPFLAILIGFSAIALFGDQSLGLLLWETALVVPAAVALLSTTTAVERPPGLGRTGFRGALPVFAVVLLFVELFLYRRGLRDASIGVSAAALLAALLFVGFGRPPLSDGGTVSEVLALGVVHEYRKLLGRLQLLLDFGGREDRGLEAAEGQPDPLPLISQEIRLSAASLPGLDALYGRKSGASQTRVPGDVEAILRLAGPLFRRTGKTLDLRAETAMVIAAPPDIVLHSLLILLRNAADYAASGSDRVVLDWKPTRPDGEALLRISNGAEVADGRLPATRGWGRGLAIARGLSWRYGGNLTIRRTRCSFSVELRFPLSKPF